MAKAVKFMLLSLVLGMAEGIKVTTSGLFGGKKGAFLSEDQLETIENNLVEAKTTKEKYEQTIADLSEDSARLSELESSLNDVNNEFELNADTPEAIVTAMAEQIRTLSGQPATEPTAPVATKEPASKGSLDGTGLFDAFMNQ